VYLPERGFSVSHNEGCFHGYRLLYFGGYGCKTIQQVRDGSPLNFIMEETSWVNDNKAPSSPAGPSLVWCLYFESAVQRSAS